jgi:hypothetical protein
MKSPFIFGKIVTGNAFINRTEEIARLKSNFLNRVNTVLISPRRWGKSSLVMESYRQTSKTNPDVLFCFLDLFRIRTEEDFYKQFALQVIKASSGRLDDWIRNVKDFMGRLSPSISFGTDPMNDFQISFGVSNGAIDRQEILNLPEKIAAKKKKSLIICIDEFQNIGNYAESLSFQQLLRSVWQHQQNVSYCIYGSKRHMMLELFEKQSMPFYKFGDLMFLQKIESPHFVKFITESFSATGKTISSQLAKKVIDRVEAHPYFVQQLAHVLWVNTDSLADEELLEYSVNELLDQSTILYQEIINGLSNTQINLLIALAAGIENLNSQEIIQQYNLGTSGNVSKIKKALISKEIIDSSYSRISYLDPVFRLWMLRSC